MADSTRNVNEVILGKKFQSEKFSTIRSAADVEEDQKLQEKYKHEHAQPLHVYFQIRGHTDHTLQAMMSAYTKVRSATLEAFDDIFHSFFSTAPKKPADTKEG